MPVFFEVLVWFWFVLVEFQVCFVNVRLRQSLFYCMHLSFNTNTMPFIILICRLYVSALRNFLQSCVNNRSNELWRNSLRRAMPSDSLGSLRLTSGGLYLLRNACFTWNCALEILSALLAGRPRAIRAQR